MLSRRDDASDGGNKGGNASGSNKGGLISLGKASDKPTNQSKGGKNGEMIDTKIWQSNSDSC